MRWKSGGRSGSRRAALLGGSRRIEAGALQENARKDEVVGIPHVRALADRLLQEAARRVVGEPALHAQAALQCQHAGPLVGPLRHVESQGLLVREGQVREIEEIVVDQEVMRGVVEMACFQPVAWIVERQRRRDRRQVGRRLAHPHPDPAAAHGDGVAAHAGALRDELLAGDLDAAPVGCELQPVIHAAQVVTFQPAHREGRETVAATILKRRQPAIGGAVKREGLIDDGTGVDGARRELGRPAGDVPGIADPHGFLRAAICPKDSTRSGRISTATTVTAFSAACSSPQ